MASIETFCTEKNAPSFPHSPFARSKFSSRKQGRQKEGRNHRRRNDARKRRIFLFFFTTIFWFKGACEGEERGEPRTNPLRVSRAMGKREREKKGKEKKRRDTIPSGHGISLKWKRGSEGRKNSIWVKFQEDLSARVTATADRIPPCAPRNNKSRRGGDDVHRQRVSFPQEGGRGWLWPARGK